MRVSVLVDKPLPSERPTGIGMAAFNMAVALSRRAFQVQYICRGRLDRTSNVNDRLTVRTIMHFSRDNLATSLDVLKKEGCDVTHVHSSSAIASLMASRAFRHPAVIHAHGDEPLHPLRLTLLRKVGMNLSKKVVATSNSTKLSIVRNQRISPKKVAVVYNGVDVDEFAPSTGPSDVLSKFGLEHFDKFVLSIGTVQGSKGQWKMVECLPRILERWPRLGYVNVGTPYDESYRARLLKRAAELGVLNSVKLLHGVSQRDLVALINAADLCVHPSTREGFGLAVVEEMACGKTVLAFAADSIPEIIDDGVDGLLVRPNDGENMIKSILGVMEDPGLRRKIGDAARAKVIARFSWDRTAMELEVLYREISS